jgi:peptide chain release factor 2
MIDKHLKGLLERLEKGHEQLSAIYNPEEIEKEITEIEDELSDGDVWSDTDRARKLSKRISYLKRIKQVFEDIKEGISEVEITKELLSDTEDREFFEEMREKEEKLLKRINRELMLSRFSGEYDDNPALMTIKPGAGGTESQDWAEMLLRMYLRWLENSGYEFKVLEYQSADEAGIKEVSLLVEGDYAYGYLKAEAGVHRLVRISPYDASKKRHTSFASVTVQPHIEEDIDIDIDENDLKIDTFHSSGAGGQHVNVTDSAVRITHLPTGIVVSCQNERSQRRNRDVAMQVLKSRLYQLYKEQEEEKIDALVDKRNIDFGSQIRSYILHPYKLVKDHRTDYETSNVDRVLDGDLDEFIEAFFLMESSNE